MVKLHCHDYFANLLKIFGAETELETEDTELGFSLYA